MARLFYIEGPTETGQISDMVGGLTSGWYWRSKLGDQRGPFTTPTLAKEDACLQGHKQAINPIHIGETKAGVTVKGWYWRAVGGITHGPFTTPTEASEDARERGFEIAL